MFRDVLIGAIRNLFFSLTHRRITLLTVVSIYSLVSYIFISNNNNGIVNSHVIPQSSRRVRNKNDGMTHSHSSTSDETVKKTLLPPKKDIIKMSNSNSIVIRAGWLTKKTQSNSLSRLRQLETSRYFIFKRVVIRPT